VIAEPGTAGALVAQLRSDPDVAAVIPDARMTVDPVALWVRSPTGDHGLVGMVVPERRPA
jgi:hypothetical protein